MIIKKKKKLKYIILIFYKYSSIDFSNIFFQSYTIKSAILIFKK